MVIKGDAGVQITGDRAKGAFPKAGRMQGKDFVCIRFPGTHGTVTFNSDQFVMFDVKGGARKATQAAMASAIESPVFPSAYNLVKGPVPARRDVADTDFDDCGKKGIKDLAAASANGTLPGLMAQAPGQPRAGEERDP